MDRRTENNPTDRNYESISPSARSLLMMKGLTNIPYAREAAALMTAPLPFNPDFSKMDIGFWARVVHFEMRYWSINQLLESIPINNVLELSSGYSFRGLDMTRRKAIHYIDTDLASIIEAKTSLIQSLRPAPREDSTLELLPLNALDEHQFIEVAGRFPKGELVIVNEGLMMYLDDGEKKKLCSIISRVLQQRGGYWITADVYLKKTIENLDLTFTEREKEFFEQHQIEDNKFESFEAAKQFFSSAGFILDKEAHADRSKPSTLKYMMKSASLVQLLKFRSRGKIQATWRLRPVSV